MKFNTLPPLKVLALTLLSFFHFSCSKDSDLLTDYVISDTSVSKGIANLVVDDTYQVSLSGSMVLDVLSNDTFETGTAVIISETSTPTNGTVAINNDETLTYTPTPEIIEQVSDTTNTNTVEVVDTFTYTAEVVNGDGTASSEEASVVITAAHNAARQEGVNLSTFGAVGDGVTDDTAALQAAFDNETNLISDAGKTYLISTNLFLNKNMAQTIDFNGSKITRKVPIDYMLWIDKSAYANSLTTISNLDVDGNDKVGSLVYVKSRVHFTNIEVHNATHNVYPNEPRGIWNTITNTPGATGQWIYDDVNIYWITHSVRGGPNDLKGKAEGFYVHWPELNTGGTQIVYKNSTVRDIYGDEGVGIQQIHGAGSIVSSGIGLSGTNNSMWYENMLIYNCERRAVKAYMGNQTWVNSNIYSADYKNPNIDVNTNSEGLFQIGTGSSNPDSENNLICGVNFYGGYTTPLDAWDNLVWVGGIYGPTSVEFRHCTFNGDNPNSRFERGYAGLVLYREITDLKVCDCDFTLATSVARGNKITQYGSPSYTGGKMQFDSNNTYLGTQAQALSTINSANYEIVDLSGDCAACPSIDD